MRKNIKRFFEPIFISKWRFTAFAFIFLLWRVYDFINILLIKKIISTIEVKNIAQLELYSLVFLLFIIIYQIFSFLRVRKFWFYEKDIKKYLYKKYFQELACLDNNILEGYWTWKIISTMKTGLDSWYQFIEIIIMNSIFMISTLIFCGILVAYISWSYFFIFLAICIIFDILSIQIGKRWLMHRTKKYDIQNECNRQMTRFIMSRNEIVQNNKWKYEAEKIANTLQQSFNEGIKQRPYEHFSYNSAEAWLSLAKICILFWIGRMVLNWSVTMSELVWIVAIISYLSNITQDFLNAIKRYMKNSVNITKLRDLFDHTPQIQWYNDGNEFKHKHWNIVIENMSYAYWEKWIFESFNYTIKWWTTTALIWPSGGWKTTLIKLIAWYLQCNNWTINVDDQELPNNLWSNNHVSLKSYYRHIGYLTQEPSVFDGSIKDNLMYAVSEKNITEDQLSNIISLAQCDWIYELKNGLDTEIGEKWIRLSWWQKQRLAIAKIMLKDPSIILLDEPTSALDSFAEEEVTKAMNNLFEWRTVIIIAHRLQTVKHANEIIVLGNKEGKVWTQILERGNHIELIAKWWFYAKMLELQSGF